MPFLRIKSVWTNKKKSTFFPTFSYLPPFDANFFVSSSILVGEVGQDRHVQIEVGDGTLDASEVDAGVADARPKGLGDGDGIRLSLDDVDEHRRAQDDGG